MQKVVWVAMGLLVAIMAAGFASQRHFFDSTPRTRIITPPSDRGAGPAVVTAPASSPRREAAATAAKARAGWQAFDTVVNLLNVVVGIAGIWMTVHGMRMQRMALEAEQQQQARWRRAA